MGALCKSFVQLELKRSRDVQDLPPPIRGPTTVPIAHMEPKENEYKRSYEGKGLENRNMQARSLELTGELDL